MSELRLPSKKGRFRPRYRFSAKQAQAIRFADAPGRLMLGVGSVRSGKTYSHCHGFVKKILALKHRYTHLCTTPGRALFMEEILPTLEKIARHRGRRFQWNNSRSVARIGNQRILYLAGNDAKSVKRARGLTIHSALISELTLLDEDYFKMILTRLSFLDSKLFSDTNPDSPRHWLKSDWIDQDKFALVQTFRLDDNPTLPAQWKKEQAETYSGVFYQRYILGEWAMAEGLILPKYETYEGSIAGKQAKRIVMGVDPAFATVYAALFALEFEDIGWVVGYPYYHDAAAQGQGSIDAKAHARKLARKAARLAESNQCKVAVCYCDPNDPQAAQALYNEGLPATTDFPKDVLLGLRACDLRLSHADVRVMADAEALLKELDLYVWDEKAQERGEDRPTKEHDHLIDCLRYIITNELPLQSAKVAFEGWRRG